jgi:hypothetical protein
MNRKNMLTIGISTAVLAVLGGMALAQQHFWSCSCFQSIGVHHNIRAIPAGPNLAFRNTEPSEPSLARRLQAIFHDSPDSAPSPEHSWCQSA